MAKVLGIEKNVVIDFVDRKRNENVHLEGMYLHLGETKKNVEGMAVSKPLFVNSSKSCYGLAQTLKVGDEIELFYNRYGSFEALDYADVD